MTLFDKHRALLDQAVHAAKTREYWSAFPENPSPKVYGETAQADGQAATQAYFNGDFPLQQTATRSWVATEQSPYGVALNVRYPDCAPADLVAAAQAAESAWQALGAQGRVGLLLEALTRIHQRTHEITHAVMLTSGQGPMMAFQAGGPHAQDRALEAIAYAWMAQADIPATAHWEKPQGKNPPLVMQKHFEVVGRGIGLVLGCATFPTWNTYPGLFASLATGNPVIVKPHPNAVLPMAITIAILRDVLREQGIDPNVVQLGLCPRNEDTQALATNPAVALIDFTGSTAFGNWLQSNAKQARLYAEMAGVNTVILESAGDYAATMKNLAFTLALYSGQMCTTTQNILIPQDGIATNEGHKSFDQIGQDLGAALAALLEDPRVATAVLGAIASPATSERITASAQVGRLVHASQKIAHPQFPQAVLQTPQLVALTEADSAIYNQECFGPVAYLVAVKDGASALTVAQNTLQQHGALTLGVYSQNPAYIDQAVRVSLRGKVALSINLTQGIYVNQSAAFSDFHATGGNPAANASYTNLAFVADRFVVVQRRAHV
ncbi:phenylacetic acid degradation protein paaN [Comamonas odontotermitis]|uniref:Phenylacetic acid degradation protein paaN n=1 Tax=Comamonas odontotermitis TaxID=379895 RepID=A0ABR6RGE9_9BURK|nr:phenylacetic acid degradation protein PaaN [Comamonas odontotermitis]MBB6578228.1 phenylacetic acid degradation protein paaN [Comamonas odontotermitis]